METETKKPESLTLSNDMGATLVVSLDRLQAIVQAAYDQHGILAAPSYAIEAALAEPIPYTLAEVEPGRCPCGEPGCSDAGYVGEYRQGFLPIDPPPADESRRRCRAAVAAARHQVVQ